MLNLMRFLFVARRWKPLQLDGAQFERFVSAGAAQPNANAATLLHKQPGGGPAAVCVVLVTVTCICLRDVRDHRTSQDNQQYQL